jgi:hypothetical protein
LEILLLTAKVIWSDTKYVARTDGLDLEATGLTIREAQDQLVQIVRSWIEDCETSASLEQSLALAGFPGVQKETELHLKFIEPEGILDY